MPSSPPTRQAAGQVPKQTRRTTLPFTKKENPMAATIAAPAGIEATPAGGKRTKLIALLLVVVVAAAAGWWFFLRDTGPHKPEAPKPGAVVALEPVTINLSSGHYLKLGLSLQQSAKAKEEANGSKALDRSIELFSGRSIDELANKDKRERLKNTLIKEIAEAYEDEVYTVYFTEFVWQ